MDSAVASEDERCVRLIGGIKFVAGKQVDARQLEALNVMRFGVRSKQGDGAHRATFAQPRRKSKWDSPGNAETKSRPEKASESARFFVILSGDGAVPAVVEVSLLSPKASIFSHILNAQRRIISCYPTMCENAKNHLIRRLQTSVLE